MSEPDPVIDEVRRVRHEISARFGHDTKALIAHLLEFQEQYADRLVKVVRVPLSAGAEEQSSQDGQRAG